MTSIFLLNGQIVARVAELEAVLPIGATISSGFTPSDPAQKSRLRVVAVHYSVRTGEVRYEMAPAS
jgi:hypothetical protein